MKLTKTQLKKLILQEMATAFKAGFESEEGHEKTKVVNSAIVDIESAIDRLEEAIADEPDGQRMVDKLRMLVDKINEAYGMDEDDFARQFEYPSDY